METDTDEFLASYIETALWSSSDDSGIPFDSAKYLDTVIADETIAKMAADCQKFKEACAGIIDPDLPQYPIARDFWLTRTRRIPGFWNEDYPRAVTQELTDLARAFPECQLYLGFDGKLYLA